MKKYIPVICLLIFNYGLSQEVSNQSLAGIDWVKITSASDLSVSIHDKNEILIKANNKDFKLTNQNKDLLVSFVADIENIEVYLPKNQNIKIESTKDALIYIDGLCGEIEINSETYGDVSIKNVTGPITANLLNANIKVVFSSVSQNLPTSIFTTYGEIEITLPENSNTNLALSTRYGELYSDIKSISEKIANDKTNGNNSITSTLNKGGVNITAKSIDGNIKLIKFSS